MDVAGEDAARYEPKSDVAKGMEKAMLSRNMLLTTLNRVFLAPGCNVDTMRVWYMLTSMPQSPGPTAEAALVARACAGESKYRFHDF